MLRSIAVIIIALVIGVQIVRTSAVRALANLQPDLAARVWASHPSVELSLALTDIATAARLGRPVPPRALRQVYAAGREAPLEPEPYLVRGVQAQVAGDAALAEQAFSAAKWRDARSRPARYFLADHYLRHGDVEAGLREIAVLSRLVPGGASKLAPYVASIARNRANWPQVRALFRTEPVLEDATLAVLAAESENAGAVLALSDPRRRGPKSPWLEPLLATLTKAGRFEAARSVWATASGIRLDRQTLLFDPNFAQPGPPAPFNWALTSSTVGLAERIRGGGLNVMFYGRDQGPLVSQLLVLSPGRYRFVAEVQGGSARADAMRWSLVCATNGDEIASAPLASAAARPWSFTITASCPAQRLELIGLSSDVPQQSNFTVRRVSLTREQSGA